MSTRIPVFTLLFLILATGLSSCNKAPAESVSISVEASEEPVAEQPAPAYDSKDTAVLVSVSTVNNTATFYNYELCKSYTLSFDGITEFTDKYGTAISASQLKPGVVADILFLRKQKKLVSYSDSSSAFRIEDLTGFSFDINAKVFEYKGDSYKITKGTILLSDSKPVSLQELNPLDIITIAGTDTTIYSITVNKGHGYLKLKGNEPFNGGFIDTGAGDIQLISDGMLMMLREGDYSMTITKNGGSAVKNVRIYSGKESTLDLSDVVIEEAVQGKILFDVDPDDAKIYVDGELVDHTRLLSFPRGLHLLTATADGYQSITRYFNIGKDTLSMEIALEKDEKTTTSTETQQTDGYFVFVSNPSDVEVYLDGNYIGMSPLSFAKKSGTHTITLRKSGFETRTYTVLIENAPDDVYYSFDNLALSGVVNNADASGNNAVTGTNTGDTGNLNESASENSR
ncbi:MAG: PEGA domain-containing protein [Lachnospiraceae bacterium]|nr:PEGA domain-containing protein [Lachnospiraceae bacterium]